MAETFSQRFKKILPLYEVSAMAAATAAAAANYFCFRYLDYRNSLDIFFR